jgi:uncharacterized protein with FMN-binding domain
MRKTAAALLSAFVVVAPAANAADVAKATPKKKVVVKTKTVTGPAAQASRWGVVQVSVTVRTTTTTIGTKRTVARKIVGLSATYPDHTDRSVYINSQAGPYLKQETLQAQSANIQLISGATDTSEAFIQSLQSAILAAKKS